MSVSNSNADYGTTIATLNIQPDTFFGLYGFTRIDFPDNGGIYIANSGLAPGHGIVVISHGQQVAGRNDFQVGTLDFPVHSFDSYADAINFVCLGNLVSTINNAGITTVGNNVADNFNTNDASGAYAVNGAQVLISPQNPINDATGTLANAVTTINLMLAMMRTHGFLQT